MSYELIRGNNRIREVPEDLKARFLSKHPQLKDKFMCLIDYQDYDDRYVLVQFNSNVDVYNAFDTEKFIGCGKIITNDISAYREKAREEIRAIKDFKMGLKLRDEGLPDNKHETIFRI
jgi:hypothetical protein